MRCVKIEQYVPGGIAEQLGRRSERPGTLRAGARDMRCLVSISGRAGDQRGESFDLAGQPLDNRRQLSMMPSRSRARWRQVAIPSIITIG